ncbi:hypothetical protein HDU77_007531 [Chytriomyces hyalinus]|nr:hypothetical protein HDU77_007531 [Chytriomyces hyalinus]
MSISRLNLIFLGFPSSDPTRTHEGAEESGDSGSDRASLDSELETRHPKKSNHMFKTGGASRRVVVELDALSTNHNTEQKEGLSINCVEPVSGKTALTVFDLVTRSAKRALSDDIGISTCFSYLRKRRRRIMTRHPKLQGSDAVWGLTVYSGSPDFSRLCLGSNAGIIRDGEILLVVWSPLEFLDSPTLNARHKLSKKSHKNAKAIPTAYDREKVDVFGVIAVSGDIHNNGKPAFVTAEAHCHGVQGVPKSEQWTITGSSNRLFQEGIQAIEQLESSMAEERHSDLMSEEEDEEAALILSPKRAAKLHDAAIETLHAISLSRSDSPSRMSPKSTILEKPTIELLTSSINANIDRSLSTLRVDGISIEKKPRLLPYSSPSSSSTPAAIQHMTQQSSKSTISTLKTSKDESIIVSFEDLHDDAHVSFDVESEAATEDPSEMVSNYNSKLQHNRSASDLVASDMSQVVLSKTPSVYSAQSSIMQTSSSLPSPPNESSSRSIRSQFDHVKLDKDLSVDGRSIKSISSVSSKSTSDKSDTNTIESGDQNDQHRMTPTGTQPEVQTIAKNPTSNSGASLEPHPLKSAEKEASQTSHSTSAIKQDSKTASIHSIPKIGSVEKVSHITDPSRAESKDQSEIHQASPSENNLFHPSSETEIFKYSLEKNSKHSSKESIKPKPEAAVEPSANDGELTPKASRAKSAELHSSTESVKHSMHLFQPTGSTANIFKSSSTTPPVKEAISRTKDPEISPTEERDHSKARLSKSDSRPSSRGSAKSPDRRSSHEQLKSRRSSTRSEKNHSKASSSSRSSQSSKSLQSRDSSHVSKDSRASSLVSKGSRDSSHALKDSRNVSKSGSEQETRKYRPVTIPNSTHGSSQKLRRPNSRRPTQGEVTSDSRSESSDTSKSKRSSNSSTRSRE